MNAIRFKDLKAGDKFEFYRPIAFGNSLVGGPWVKVDRHVYEHADSKNQHVVGTIQVKVVKVS